MANPITKLKFDISKLQKIEFKELVEHNGTIQNADFMPGDYDTIELVERKKTYDLLECIKDLGNNDKAIDIWKGKFVS